MDDQTFINQLAEKLSKLSAVRPLGFHYLHPYGTAPADSIICNGAAYYRSLYKDFFDYITAQGWVKTEAEWQEIAKRDNGFCPFYSDGNGSTSFRTPKFAPYMQVAMRATKATAYHQAGLPNITGYWDTRGPEILPNATGGAFSIEKTSDNYSNGHTQGGSAPKLKLDASSSSLVYGRSSTVQPESHEWMICVVVAGQATNIGSVDMTNVLTTVAQVQADVSQVQADISQVQANVGAIPRPNAYVTKTWRSGTEWYRVWSDKWIEQGGHGKGGACTFSKPFSDKNYTFNVQPSSDYSSHPDWVAAYELRSKRTTTGTGISLYSGGEQGWDWRASGY